MFAAASTCLAAQGRDGYQPVLACIDGQPVATPMGLTFATARLPDPHQPVDTVVLPGGRGVHAARENPQLIAWIRDVAHSARRVVSVCTGAFLAAQAGLLDGCTATTHWAYADQLRREFPSITVDPEPIFVRSSATAWTAAGVTAGIDLALSLVEDDHGTDVARRWPAGWCCTCAARAGKPSSPPRCGCPAPNVNRSAACRKRSSPSPAPRTASPSWPAGLA
ncbi:DJ-1/PfpI family protein [Mycobacterium xenopi 4042]|uniref:DJ-1/PfpI family protein n=1 Tax=Mycobacterium xenopi 4042 TaxID=1299334 RepID=X8CAB2_MYCXE|nr:DJ-1/PfpI family protein [Mycobacterium xenopi 4042]